MPTSPMPATSNLAAGDRDELAFLGLEQQVLLLVTGQVSSRELVELSLERAEEAQPRLNAFRVMRAEQALAEADAADRRLAGGEAAPLLGVPVAIKDDVDLASHTTPFGCGGEHRAAVRDAEAVRRLREAGAIVIGKTHAPEVGQWHFTETPAFGATRNPCNTDHTPGGSSGGAAAAVAAGLVAAAIGSDGAGSIRIPAAWTGLVGLKPQRGRISDLARTRRASTASAASARSPAASAMRPFSSTPSTATCRPIRTGPRRRKSPLPNPASREPGRLRVALSFATPSACRARSTTSTGRRSRRFAAAARPSWAMTSSTADPDYGLVGLGAGAARHGRDRGMAPHPRRRPAPRWRPRTRTHARFGRASERLAPCASRGPPSRRCARRIGRVFERCRRRPHPDHGEAPAAHRRPRRPRLLGDQHHRQRHLPLRLRLERRRLAGDQRPGRVHRLAAFRSAPSSSGVKTTRRPCSRLAGAVERASGGWPAAETPGTAFGHRQRRRLSA